MENNQTAVKKVPIGIKIIAILYVVIGLITLKAAIVLMQMGGMPFVQGNIIAISAIMFSAIYIFFAIGIWCLKKWARFLVITFSAIQFIGALKVLLDNTGGVGNGIVLVLVHGFVLYYFTFSKNGKNAFVKKAVPTVPPQASMPM